MSHPPATLSRTRLVEALVATLDRAMPTCSRFAYRLVGTGAALLHGVDLPAADIDILVRERKAVDAFGAALSEFKCIDEPAWLPDAKQYYGNWEVTGVEVGFSTVELESDLDTIETFGRGPWEHFVHLPCGSHEVPTVSLELRLITEVCRGRAERYGPLIEHLRAKGCDLGLVHRGLVTRGQPEEVREQVMRRLRRFP